MWYNIFTVLLYIIKVITDLVIDVNNNTICIKPFNSNEKVRYYIFAF